MGAAALADDRARDGRCQRLRGGASDMRLNLTPAGWRRLTVLLVTVWLTFVTAWSYTAQTSSQSQRRHDNCVSRQRLYDGQFVMVHYLARQFRVTEEQEAVGIDALRDVLGARPAC